MAHQAGAYPGFCSMKRLGVFLLPPGWDASPSQGYPLACGDPVFEAQLRFHRGRAMFSQSAKEKATRKVKEAVRGHAKMVSR